MKRSYQLIKLKIETVQGLKRLMSQTGQASLDDLIVAMIQTMDYKGRRKNETLRRSVENCGTPN